MRAATALATIVPLALGEPAGPGEPCRPVSLWLLLVRPVPAIRLLLAVLGTLRAREPVNALRISDAALQSGRSRRTGHGNR